MSPTDHDRIVSVEGTVGTLCTDVNELKDSAREVRDFMVEVRSTTSLVKWQIVTTLLGFGGLGTLILMFH